MTSLRVLCGEARAAAVWTDAAPPRPELWLTSIDGEAIVLGAFERASTPSRLPRVRRVTGGPTLHVANGVMVARLLLPIGLTAAEPSQLLNRYVRPFLRALNAFGLRATYAGRDWIACGRRPGGFIGFAHDASTGRAVIEVVLSVASHCFHAARESFRGTLPTTLQELVPSVVHGALVEQVVAGFEKEFGVHIERGALPTHRDQDALLDEAPWARTLAVPIGVVGVAGTTVGGDWMVSSQVPTRLSAALGRGAPEAELLAVLTRADSVIFGADPRAVATFLAQHSSPPER